MSIRKIADNMYKVKRIGNEYATKKEYKNYCKEKRIERWENSQETTEERKSRMENLDIWKINECLGVVDKKFLKEIENFLDNNDIVSIGIDDRILSIVNARKIICNYIIERFNLLANLRALFIPVCNNETDVNMWFQENCHNIGLSIPPNHRSHIKFKILNSICSGIDYVCKFLDTDKLTMAYSNCDRDEYVPRLYKYLDDKQRILYHKFLDFCDAGHLLIELEFLSSNFIKHRHPRIVDMIICYEKDKDFNIPILNLLK